MNSIYSELNELPQKTNNFNKMKKIILLLFVVTTSIFSWGKETDKITANKDDVLAVDDKNKNSMVRMQNKVIAGIETSLNPSVTADDDSMFRTLASFRIGYRLKQHVLTGSLGVEFTDVMFMPITIDYKYYFKYDQKWSPYVYGQAGYSWHLKGNINSSYVSSNYKQIDPGALASIGFGYSVTTSLNEFYFSLGYAYRNYVEVTPAPNKKTNSLDKTNKGLALTLGFNF